MYTTALLTTLLSATVVSSTLGSAIPSISSSLSTNTTTILPRAPKGCPMTHYPTESQYRLAVRQHCTKHYPSSGARRIPHAKKLVYTYTLTDYRGYPIRWILSTDYLAGDIHTGSLEATRQDCYDRFNAFIDGGTGIGDEGGESKTWCTVNVRKYGRGKDGIEGERLVMGGKYDQFRKRSGDMQVWVETRKRDDDKFRPPPEIHIT